MNQPTPIHPSRFGRSSNRGPTQPAAHEREHGEDDEDKEENTCRIGGYTRDAEETKQSCNQGDHKEQNRKPQHRKTLHENGVSTRSTRTLWCGKLGSTWRAETQP